MFPGDTGTPPNPADSTPGSSQDGPADSSNGHAGQPAPGGPPSPPSVSLPTGGGAIRGIGETFAVSAATGTASLAVPVATSPGRGGFGPALSLDYDSGAGNSPFGLGWRVSLPAVTRKTDKGLPRYHDDPDLDTFLLSGAEDLVPVREERDGTWEQAPEYRSAQGRRFLVQRYRPRIEGSFSRIERWCDLGSGETHWRSITSGNVTTVYGATPASRVADPADPARVFSWLICESYDDSGNATAYDYAAEDTAGVDTSLACERNRTELSRSAARYPKRIRYGNRVPHLTASELAANPEVMHPGGERADHNDWMFEVVFDYGDHDQLAPQPEPTGPWPSRPDPFSTYRPGFEVRTYRRCHRVLMFHHFTEEPGVGAHCLVGSTDLTYQSTGGSGMTTVASVTHSGYRRRPGGGYHSQSLPLLEFRYSRAVIGRHPRDLSEGALRNLPVGIDGRAYQWLDLDGEGVSGVLAREGGAWFYKANLGDGRFAPERMLATQPAAAGGKPYNTERLLDLAGDGHLDLADLGGPTAGFYGRAFDGGWRPFRAFRSHPNISWDDPDLRMVDLDGDGLADVLITGDDAFTWYPSLGYEGFGPAVRAFQPWSEEQGPRVVFADPEQAIYLTDMSGDGLADLVRVRVGEVCYWPNTGFGTFGAKVTMDGIPWLDEPDHFDQRRVRLADVDGSGMADLVYLHRDGTRVYLNQSGNGFGDPEVLPQGFPRLDSLAEVMVADLLGRGTGCLVWSSPLPADSGRQLRYLDLMSAGKPYLLTGVINNLGAETLISYAPSTQFYLADQAAGRPWITRLPFPVHVVEKVETIDRVNRNRFTTRHAYHHGYYDGFEREFRGFGLVEQWDTEDLAVLESAGDGFENLGRASDLPPVLTRTWLHTGVFPGDNQVSRQYAHEYCRQPGDGAPDLPDTTLPATLRLSGRPPQPWRLSRTEAREACRALKGMPLRSEVYALDGTEAEGRPYLVTEHNYTIELLQPAITPVPDGPQNYHAVLLTHDRESVTAHYERVLYPVDGELRADARITHDVVLAIDDYGNPLRLASAGYGRRHPDPGLAPQDQAAQARPRLTYTDNGYTNAVERPDAHRTPMPAQTRVFEVVGLAPAGQLFGFAELRDGLADISAELPFQDWDADPDRLAAPARRLISHTSVLYRRDDMTGALPPGVLEPLALPYRSYRQAFTEGLVAGLYGGRVDAGALRDAGYLREGGTWRLPSGQVFYSRSDDDDPAAELDYARRHFFRPHRFTDPFGNTTTISYDRYDLLTRQTQDPLGNLFTAGERDPADELTVDGNDYRVLAPRLVSDPNRNRAAAAFDVLGRICGTAVMGKPQERLGDSLDGFDPDLPAAAVEGYFADPSGLGHELLGQATTRILYDMDAYWRSRGERPAGVAVLARETHVSDLAAGEQTRIQRRFDYSDGFGREIQRKSQAAAGPVVDGGPDVRHRWIGSGWTVFNNKGKPVRQYEPFFTGTHQFEFDVRIGVSPVLCYDPLTRLVATVHPNHAWEKVLFDPWREERWDVNDTVLLDPANDDVAGPFARRLPSQDYLPTWYDQRAGGALGAAEQEVAAKTAVHASTPAVAYTDALGRAFLTVDHNRFLRDGTPVQERYRTRVALDIQGNKRQIHDANERLAMRHDYDMLGTTAHQASMEAGERWALQDVAGAAISAWDSREHHFRTAYDPLRRPAESYLRDGTGPEQLIGRTVYGETQPAPEAANLRGKVAKQYDQAGVITTGRYDFKGNLLRSARQLAREYKTTIDWASAVGLETETFQAHTSYDALNRPALVTTPDLSAYRPTFNQAGLLETIDVHLRGEQTATTFVANIDYNAKGQRQLIVHGNGVATRYSYDPLTFRLTRLITKRTADQARLQDLSYTYDPARNITRITDAAQQTIFFSNQVVTPSADYTYDAVYRLIAATGREHIGQLSQPQTTRDERRAHPPHPGDGEAMRRYREQYEYDPVGNVQRMIHRAANGNWTRAYVYDEPSQLEAGKRSNRLSDTTVGGGTPEPHTYDAHGNMTAMPHLPLMEWDFEDHLQATARQAATSGSPQTTFYVYDSGGQRARKVTEAPNGARKDERAYLGSFEIFRKYGPAGTVMLERETLHVMDDKQRIALAETRTLDTGDSDPAPQQLIRYQFGNHLGSTSLELDDQAHIISYEEYVPYGSTSYQAVRLRTQTPKRYRYSGKERDEESGLYYYGARYYAPWLGRWISCDPAGLVDGANLYWFVRNSPVVLSDPSGAFPSAPVIDFIEEQLPRLAARAPPAGAALVADAAAPVVAAAAAPAAATAGGTLTLGGIASSAALVGVALTGAVIAATGFAAFTQSNAIAESGNFTGVHDPGMGILQYARPWAARPAPPRTVPLLPPAPDQELYPRPRTGKETREKPKEKEENKKPKLGRIYVTYQKFNHATGLYYSGRTSMVVDLKKPLRPQALEAIALRDLNHHIDYDENEEPQGPGFEPADLDKFDVGTAVDYADRYDDLGYKAIRGREQMLIDYRGGAQSDTKPGPKQTENTVRGVAKDNDWGRAFHAIAIFRFGEELHEYTGR